MKEMYLNCCMMSCVVENKQIRTLIFHNETGDTLVPECLYEKRGHTQHLMLHYF